MTFVELAGKREEDRGARKKLSGRQLLGLSDHLHDDLAGRLDRVDHSGCLACKRNEHVAAARP